MKRAFLLKRRISEIGIVYPISGIDKEAEKTAATFEKVAAANISLRREQ